MYEVVNSRKAEFGEKQVRSQNYKGSRHTSTRQTNRQAGRQSGKQASRQAGNNTTMALSIIWFGSSSYILYRRRYKMPAGIIHVHSTMKPKSNNYNVLLFFFKYNSGRCYECLLVRKMKLRLTGA